MTVKLINKSWIIHHERGGGIYEPVIKMVPWADIGYTVTSPPTPIFKNTVSTSEGEGEWSTPLFSPTSFFTFPRKRQTRVTTLSRHSVHISLMNGTKKNVD